MNDAQKNLREMAKALQPRPIAVQLESNMTTSQSAYAVIARVLDDALLAPYFVMLALGVLHGAYPAVPAMGFIHTWLAVFIAGKVGFKPPLDPIYRYRAKATL